MNRTARLANAYPSATPGTLPATPISRALCDDRRGQPAPRHAQHAQQRELRAPPHDRERLRREHEQAAGEQRNQRQHVEIDPVGPRQAGTRVRSSRRGPFRSDPRRQDRAQPLAQRADVDAGPHPQVDPRDPRPAGRTRPARPRCPSPQSAARLPPRACPATRSGTSDKRDFESHDVSRATPSNRAAAGLRNSASERSVSRRSAGVAIKPGWIQPARNTSMPMIRSDSLRPASFASTSTTGLATATSAMRARSGYNASSNPARGPRTSRSASPGEHVHALRELVDRRRVDELHRVPERHAERDREHGERDAHPVLRQRAAKHRCASRPRAAGAPLRRQLSSAGNAHGARPRRASGCDRPSAPPRASASPECRRRREPSPGRAAGRARPPRCPDRDCRWARRRAPAAARARARGRSRPAAARRRKARAACSRRDRRTRPPRAFPRPGVRSTRHPCRRATGAARRSARP